MTKVAFLVSGDRNSPMAYRARAFAQRLRGRYDIQIAYREGNKIIASFRFWDFLRRLRPDVTYVFDISYSAVFGAWLHRLLNRNVVLIVETGDAIYELMRSSGNRGRIGLWLTRQLENFSLRFANRVVVRGSYHQTSLAEQGIAADVVPDGVDCKQFSPQNAVALRQKYGINGELTVGLVGSSIWSEKLQMCYGWELVELLRLLKDQPVKGIMIGDGSGVAHLKTRCHDYGIEDRIIFVGRVDYEQLPSYLGMLDVCLSTQTNDIVGQVRTTGKLPLYLAAGRFILASKVGEASRVLNNEMLVEYDGVKDSSYPQKLRARVDSILADRALLDISKETVAVAQRHFDYTVLSKRFAEIIDDAVAVETRARWLQTQPPNRNMPASEQTILAGHFAKKQLVSKSRLISWTHRSRFHVALRLSEQFAGKRLLDYGSGDGSFLAMLMGTSHAPSVAVGAEVDTRVIAECRERLRNDSGVRFIATADLEGEEHAGGYDAIVCMEVLEHVLRPRTLLEQFARLLSPSGKLLISVPVETGLPLLVKQSVRRIAGWRGIGDYPGTTGYTPRQFAKSLFANSNRQHIVRPIHTNSGGDPVHDHKGFNWMLLKKQLAGDFEIERVVGSPLTWLTPHLASQVWFLARKKS